jgi:hypothetical protein
MAYEPISPAYFIIPFNSCACKHPFIASRQRRGEHVLAVANTLSSGRILYVVHVVSNESWSVYHPLVARQRRGEHVLAAANTLNNGRILYVVLVSKESWCIPLWLPGNDVVSTVSQQRLHSTMEEFFMWSMSYQRSLGVSPYGCQATTWWAHSRISEYTQQWKNFFMWSMYQSSLGLCIPLSLLGNDVVNTFSRQRIHSTVEEFFMWSLYQRSLGLCIPLWLLGNVVLNTFSRQRLHSTVEEFFMWSMSYQRSLGLCINYRC